MIFSAIWIWVFAFSLSALAGKKLTAQEKEAFFAADKEIFHLTAFNFDALIKSGTWAVFYGLRACTHCSRYLSLDNDRFTPVWRQLEQAQDYSPMRLAKVECMNVEDRSVLPLCDFVNGFPNIFLHQDGKFKEEMQGDLNYNLTLTWLNEMRRKYIDKTKLNLSNGSNDSKIATGSNDLKNSSITNSSITNQTIEVVKSNPKAGIVKTEITGMDKLQEILENEREPSPDINPDGQVVHLTSDDFDEKTAGKVWFVMFHAPWCGHCKNLAPVWEELARQVKGYINIGKVDATKETKLQERFGIDRFPVLKLLPDLEPVAYSGDRSLKDLSKAVMKFVSAPFFTAVNSLDIERLQKENEVGFFLIFDPITMNDQILNNFEMAVRPWVGSIKIFVTPDIDAHSKLGSSKSKTPILVVSKEYGIELESFNGSFHNVSYLASWIKSVKDPLVLELDASNQAQIFSGNSLVVLALVDRDSDKKKWSPDLEHVAKTWKSLERTVIFVWLDCILHSGYVERVYSVKSTQLPQLVIADPKNSEFYNTDIDGLPFTFDKSKIPTYLSDLMQGKLKSKSTSGLLGTLARKAINSGRYVSNLVFSNPIILVMIVLLILYVFYTCIRIGLSGYTIVDSKTD